MKLVPKKRYVVKLKGKYDAPGVWGFTRRSATRYSRKDAYRRARNLSEFGDVRVVKLVRRK